MKLDLNSKTLVLLQGLPGAGKSTFVKKWELEGYTLCKDEFRILAGCVKNGEISQDSNGVIKRIVYMLLEERLKNGVFTVIDETNVFNTTVEKYSEYAQKYGFDVVIVRFNTSKEECKNRQSQRGFRAVSDELIDHMNKFFVHTKNKSIDADKIDGVIREGDVV
jgi:predicted kinase